MNLALRFLSGIVLVPVFLYIIFVGGLALDAAACLVTAISAYELFAMAFPRSKRLALVYGFLGALFFVSILSCTTAIHAFLIIFVLCAATGIGTLFQGADKNRSQKLHFLMFGVSYVCLGVASMVFLRQINEPLFLGRNSLFLVLIVVWLNDIFAYFFGRAFGRRQLAPRISQSKTWEGFIGGAVFCVSIPAAIYFILTKFTSISLSLSLTDILFIAIAGIFLGPAGDLIESQMKRAHGVKDSGSILPGHGGILDRIDALLLLAPLALCYTLMYH